MTSLLEEAIEAWDGARRGVIAEASGIPARDYDFSPTPEARSVAELVAHIVASGMMWTNELTRAHLPTSPARASRRSSGTTPARPARRARAPEWLAACCAAATATEPGKIRAAGEVQMLQYVRRFRRRARHPPHLDAPRESPTRSTNRAQLALYARLLGRTPRPHAGDRGCGRVRGPVHSARFPGYCSARSSARAPERMPSIE